MDLLNYELVKLYLIELDNQTANEGAVFTWVIYI